MKLAGYGIALIALMVLLGAWLEDLYTVIQFYKKGGEYEDDSEDW